MRLGAESGPIQGSRSRNVLRQLAKRREAETGPARQRLGPEAYRAMYDNSPEGVLFTAPDGRVLAANSAACRILGRTEAEICALGRQGMSDHSDDRWGPLLAERQRTGRVHGVARMIRGDGVVIEVEISAQVFNQSDSEPRTCTIIDDVTERVEMEGELLEMSQRLRELTMTDELTELRNRRGFLTVASQMLEVAERRNVTAEVLYLDIDNFKKLNDDYGHDAGDAGLRAVARSLIHTLRHEDVVARIGGDEFVALTLGLDERRRGDLEARIRECLRVESAVAGLAQPIEASIGWAMRVPCEVATVEDLLTKADHAMYYAKGDRHGVREGER